MNLIYKGKNCALRGLHKIFYGCHVHYTNPLMRKSHPNE